MSETETTVKLTATVTYAFARRNSDYGSPDQDVTLTWYEFGWRTGWSAWTTNKGDREQYAWFDNTRDLIAWLQGDNVILWQLDGELASIGDLLAVI
ncbi:hypothetical protein SEA_GORKO_99 [Gordonia phage Gorko]|uniref:Uncharacterized protein n=1 Tax=Gordonia phage Gorko TaxID=2571248 RepID=A0A4Y6ES10_9CAUD|nr:hypothetical protein SEA_GORKO_99 [Gordonia phage Gorko]